MKRYIIYMVRLAAVMAAVAVTAVSCVEDLPEGGRGIPVKFGVRTGALPLTRTAYSGETSNEGGTTRERINWQSGDRITIISPDARVYDMSTNPYGLKMSTTGDNAHARGGYEVARVNVDPNDNAVHHAGINPIKADATPQDDDGDGEGLQFPESGIPGNFRFFAMYPAKSSMPMTIQGEGSVGISWDRGRKFTGMPDGAAVLKAKIESSQSSPGTTYTAEPDMRYAYMYADTVMHVESTDKVPGVELSFKPMITTFQFAVRRDSETSGTVKLHRLEIVSNTCALCGNFEAELFVSVEGDTFKDAVRYTVPAFAKDGNDHVVFYLEGEKGSKGIELQSNRDTKITLFVLPKGKAYRTPKADGATTITDLTVRFYLTAGGENVGKSLALKPAEGSVYGSNITLSSNGFIEFPAGKKINISGLTVPKQIDEWRFSVEAEDLGDELSDVVVAPVQVRDFDIVDGGRLDQKLYNLLVFDENGDILNEINLNGDASLSDSLKNVTIYSYTSDPNLTGNNKTEEPWVVEYSADGITWGTPSEAALNPKLSWMLLKSGNNLTEGGDGCADDTGEARTFDIAGNTATPARVTETGSFAIAELNANQVAGTRDLSLYNIYGEPYSSQSAVSSSPRMGITRPTAT